MRRLMDVAALTGEFTRYLLASPADERGQRLAFSEALLDKIAQGRVRERARPFMLGYAVVSALDERRYATVFQVLKRFGEEAPWQRMSESLLTRIFEAAIVADELAVAQRALDQLATGALVKGPERDAMQTLIEWRAGRVAESAIDLERRYFYAHPEYDEYFKGRIAAETGRPADALQHLRRCLELAPADALELRENAMRLIRQQGGS
jgi:hypothetical protein